MKNLIPEEEQIIIHKGTETAFSGKYDIFLNYCVNSLSLGFMPEQKKKIIEAIK